VNAYISGNTMGILLGAGNPAPAAVNTTIYGNYIGTDVSGTQSLGNQWLGVGVGVGSLDVSIGSDTSPALANTIANNGSGLSSALHTAVNGPGVWIAAFRATPYDISVQGNAIYGNAGLGIDLGGDFPSPGPDGVTPNDSQGHGGPNNFQDFPALASATSSDSGTFLTGSFSEAAEPDTTLILDFYVNPSADPSGYGQGQTYLGSRTVTTDGNGYVGFSAALAVGGLWSGSGSVPRRPTPAATPRNSRPTSRQRPPARTSRRACRPPCPKAPPVPTR
jgi:hypothetical protein